MSLIISDFKNEGLFPSISLASSSLRKLPLYCVKKVKLSGFHFNPTSEWKATEIFDRRVSLIFLNGLSSHDDEEEGLDT